MSKKRVPRTASREDEGDPITIVIQKRRVVAPANALYGGGLYAFEISVSQNGKLTPVGKLAGFTPICDIVTHAEHKLEE
ncbi:MAG: hypothetical protein ACD_76C00088G0003 [uncultured bacterium]|nr:MAG: hypothetical protein ACD_76C00088G0003 [uncultured bacterium]HBD05329.1 hypothetical protein [Candidatus Uhrbacteria bacterium]